MQAETIYRPVFSTLFTLFYNVTFSLFVLVVLNVLLKRYIPGIAFHPSELLIVYVMLSIATAIFGHDLMLVMIQNLSAFWFATPENQWSVLFGKHLPHWLSVVDEQALIGYQHGESTLYNEINLKAWLIPGAFWGGFLIILLLVLICINTVVRKQWTENEKLAYPIIQLPLELARGGTGLLGNRGLWLGFALAGGMDIINGVHGIFPSFPALKPTYDVTPLFTTKPWNAIGWTPVAVYPFVVGLGYFLPLNLSFSAWFFHVFWKSELIFRNAVGIWSVPGPYRSFETAGAWIVIAFVALWGSRKYLKQVAAWTIRGQPPEITADEPMTYRTAIGGMLVGGAILVLALSYAGMTPWIAILFLLIYIVYAVAIARIRAEIGPPAHDAEWIGPEMMLLNSLGARTVGQRNIALFSRTYWMSRAYRSHPVGHQLEGFKIAQSVGASSRGFLGAMVIAIVVGTIAGFWVFLDSMYRHGALNVYHNISNESFRRLEVWLENPLEGNNQMLMDVGLGAGITIVLTLLHQRFVGFPFHPVGYAVACGWVLSVAWASLFCAWLIKWCILRIGGIRLYRKAVPFFVGLILGQHVIGGLWTIFGEIRGAHVHQFFPYAF